MTFSTGEYNVLKYGQWTDKQGVCTRCGISAPSFSKHDDTRLCGSCYQHIARSVSRTISEHGEPMMGYCYGCHIDNVSGMVGKNLTHMLLCVECQSKGTQTANLAYHLYLDYQEQDKCQWCC